MRTALVVAVVLATALIPASSSKGSSMTEIPAPTVTVSGNALNWTQVGEYTSYIVRRKVPASQLVGRSLAEQAELKRAQTWVVNALTYTPEALPGITAHYQVRVNAVGSSFSKPTSNIAYTDVPRDTTLPTITGSPYVGSVLTAVNGEWSGSPTSRTHQWLRCDTAGENPVPISGATGQTYTLVEADAGHTIRVQEQASNSVGAGALVTSTPTEGINRPAQVHKLLYQGDAASWADSMISGHPAFVAAHWTGFSRDYPPHIAGYVTSVPQVKWTPYRDAWTHNSESSESGEGRFKLATDAGRKAFLKVLEEDMAVGAVGHWLDDWQYAGGHRPAEPELAGWNEGQTLVVEALRAKYPNAFYTTNTHWFETLPNIIKGGRTLQSMIAFKQAAADPMYDRMLRALGSGGGGAIFEEWGCGTTSGLRFHSASSYAEWLRYVEWLHVVYHVGIAVGWDYSEGTNLEPLEWDLATLLLVTNGIHDHIDGGHQTDSTWMHLYDLDVGEPLPGAEGERKRSSAGLWSRAFSKGLVYTVEHGSVEQTITLPRSMENSKGEHVTSLKLKADQGAVLVY